MKFSFPFSNSKSDWKRGMRFNLFPSNYLENESNPEVKLVYLVLVQAYSFPG
jgi:hypothetical protein